MIGFTPWQAHDLQGNAVIEAQRDWLSRQAEALSLRLHLDSSRSAVGECLEQLLSGLLQALVSEEEAYAQLGQPVDAQHQAEHNALCMDLLHLIQRHEQGEPVGLQLLQRLQDWLSQHCDGTHRRALH